MSRKKTIVVIFTLGLICRLIYLALIPLNETPDGIYHFERIYFTAVKLRFPHLINSHREIFPNSTYTAPPLFYLLYALFISPFLKPPLLSTRQAFAILGPPLRIISLIISLITLTLTTKFVNSLYQRLTVIATSIIFLLPQWATSAWWINSDPLFVFFMVVTVFIGTIILVRPYRYWYPVSLAILASLGILTKPLGSFLWVGVLSGIFASKSWKENRVTAAILFTFTTFILTGWWYIRNYYLTGSFLATPAVIATANLYTKPFSFPFYTWAVIYFTVASFIATFGPTNNIHLPVGLYLIISLFILFFISQIGVDNSWLSLVKKKKQQLFLTITITMMVLAVIEFIIINTTLSFQPQGRYLYPLFFLFPLLTAAGMQALTPARFHSILTWITVIILLLLNAWGMHCIASRYWGRSILPQGVGCTYHRVNLPQWDDPLELK